MKEKLLAFKSSQSPAKIEINEGNSNVLLDWKRLNWETSFVDGQTLSTIMKMRGVSKETLTGDALNSFFSEVILKKYSGNKEGFVTHLNKTFHQGGLLHPASAGMMHALKHEEFGASANHNTKQVNIKTSENGFHIQEIYTVTKCTATINATDDFNLEFPDGILTAPDKKYIFQAQTTLDVSIKNSDLSTAIVSNTINFEHDYVQDIADKRSWLDKFADFFKNIFKSNLVTNLANTEDETLNQAPENKL